VAEEDLQQCMEETLQSCLFLKRHRKQIASVVVMLCCGDVVLCCKAQQNFVSFCGSSNIFQMHKLVRSKIKLLLL